MELHSLTFLYFIYKNDTAVQATILRKRFQLICYKIFCNESIYVTSRALLNCINWLYARFCHNKLKIG